MLVAVSLAVLVFAGLVYGFAVWLTREARRERRESFRLLELERAAASAERALLIEQMDGLLNRIGVLAGRPMQSPAPPNFPPVDETVNGSLEAEPAAALWDPTEL